LIWLIEIHVRIIATETYKTSRDLGAGRGAVQAAQASSSSGDARLQAIRDSGSIPWYDIEALEAPD
jgi:hypothetical protein